MRGVIFRVTDAKIHEDPSHRGASQIMPISQNGCRAAFLASEPRLMEPIFLCTIKTEESRRGDVYTCIGNRRGRVISDDYDYGKMITIKAYLPVAESFGFTTYLRQQTQGTAQPMNQFSHWEIMEDDPYKEDSSTNQIVKKIRARKGLNPALPLPEQYNDKL